MKCVKTQLHYTTTVTKYMASKDFSHVIYLNKPNRRNQSVCSPQLPAFKNRKENWQIRMACNGSLPSSRQSHRQEVPGLLQQPLALFFKNFSAIFASSESRQENLVLDLLLEQELFKNRILNRRLRKKQFQTSADTQYFHMLDSTFKGQQDGSRGKSTCSTNLTYTLIKKLSR